MAAAAPLILSAAVSLASASQKQSQASIEAGQAEVAAQQQELQLVQREADRKDRLSSAMAAQNALAGASGIAAFEGSPLTVLEDSIQRANVATERDTFSTDLTALATRSSGQIRQKFANVNARLGLLQQGASLAQSGIGGARA